MNCVYLSRVFYPGEPRGIFTDVDDSDPHFMTVVRGVGGICAGKRLGNRTTEVDPFQLTTFTVLD